MGTGHDASPSDIADRPPRRRPSASSLVQRSEPVTAQVTVWVIVAFLTTQLIVSELTQQPLSQWQRILGVVGGITCAACFLLLHRLLVTGRRAHTALLAAFVVVLGGGLLPLGGWSLVGLSFAAMLLTMPFGRGLAATLLLTVAVSFVVDEGTANPVQQVVIPAVAWLVGIGLFSLTRLVVVLDDLMVAREELARSKVDEERHRIARDLHDLMGRALVSASLRSEAALRMVDRDPEAAKVHLVHLHQVVADGQAQLRQISTGPAITDLETETASARELCERLGIRHTIATHAELNPEQSQLAAMVLREAITNMLKHSRPKQCWIMARSESQEVVLTVMNDRCPPPTAHPSAGTGLRELQDKAQQLNGSIEARRVGSDRFVVILRQPVVAPGAPDLADPAGPSHPDTVASARIPNDPEA